MARRVLDFCAIINWFASFTTSISPLVWFGSNLYLMWPNFLLVVCMTMFVIVIQIQLYIGQIQMSLTVNHTTSTKCIVIWHQKHVSLPGCRMIPPHKNLYLPGYALKIYFRTQFQTYCNKHWPEYLFVSQSTIHDYITHSTFLTVWFTSINHNLPCNRC